MLIAIGPGVSNLQDYTNSISAESVTIKSAQGDTLDELTCVVHDPNSSSVISNEDDIVILDEQDPNGWPTVNLCANPSFSGTYAPYNSYGNVATGVKIYAPNTVGTITAASTATSLYGSTAQSLSWSNVDSNLEIFLYQSANLPKDENGNVIRTMYCASVYANPTSSFNNTNLYMQIDWHDSTGAYISSANGYAYANPSSSIGWKRFWVMGTPPSNATTATFGVDTHTMVNTIANPTAAPTLSTATTGGTVAAGTYTIGYTWVGAHGETLLSPTATITTTGTTSTISVTSPALPTGASGWNYYVSAVGTTTPLYLQNTSALTSAGTATLTNPPVTTGRSNPPSSNTAIGPNGGGVAIDGLQFERMTYAGINLPADYSDGFLNKQMNGTVGSGTVTSWNTGNTATGVAYSVVSTPALYASAQQVALSSNAASSTVSGIKQAASKWNISGNYTITMRYRITAALNSVTQLCLGVNWHDIYGLFIGSSSVTGALGSGFSDNWQTFSIQIGPNTGVVPPANAASPEIFAGIYNPTGVGGGTIVIGEIVITPFSTNDPYTVAGSTAYGDGKYPTPYCDNTQAGCYTDSGYTGLYYRHLRLFGGYVRHAKYDYTMSRERWVEVDAVDYGVLLAEAPATLIIRAQNDSAAIAQAFQYAQNLGFLVGIDYTTYVATIATVDSMVFNWQTTRDVLSKIADTTVASYYVDYYKRLHYQPALANSAPFGVSDTPSNAASPPTYPMSGLSIDNDSSQMLNSPVIEGSTQLSTPQTFSQTCDQTTLGAALTNGSTYSTITVAAITNAIPAGTYLVLSNAGHTQQIYVETAASASATSINVSSGPGATTFVANFSYPVTTTTVYTGGVTINGGSAITQVDSCSIGGTSRSVGLVSVNQFSQGYDTLLDPGPGIIYFNSTVYPANNGVVSVTYRFTFPVLVRLTNPNPSTSGRKVHHHTKHDEVSSKQSAIDRANADLSQYQKAQAIGELVITSPPVPRGLNLTSGMAIPVTHAGAGYSQTLFQIQEIETTFGGNGYMMRKLKLGFYRPDFMVHLAQTRRSVFSRATAAGNDTILQDVVSVSDQWAITDSLSHSVSNNGSWGGASTWDGTYCWA